MQKITDLLKWARRNELYIEICGDGSTSVEDPDENSFYEHLSTGDTLQKALLKARKILAEKRRSK